MDLCKAGVAEKGSFLMGFPGRRHITAHGIGREIEYISIPAAAKKYCVTEMPFQFPGYEVTCDDAAGFAVYHYDVQHLMAGIHGHIPEGYLSFQGLVGADQQLLTRL